MRLCLICFPAPFLHTKQWWPNASTVPPQTQSWGRHRGAPILRPTAMRSSSFSRSSPQFEEGIACSQSPECGAEAARILAWSKLDGHIESRRRFNTSTTNPSQERCFTAAGPTTGAAEVHSDQCERHMSKSVSGSADRVGMISFCAWSGTHSRSQKGGRCQRDHWSYTYSSIANRQRSLQPLMIRETHIQHRLLSQSLQLYETAPKSHYQNSRKCAKYRAAWERLYSE